MLHQHSTPMEEAEHNVKRFAFSLVEALMLANTLGYEQEHRANGAFFGPNLPISLLNSTDLRISEHV